MDSNLVWTNNTESNTEYFWNIWKSFRGRHKFTINNHHLRIKDKYTKLEMSCLKCKHSFIIGVESFLLWRKCPVCYPIPCASSGEYKVQQYLKNNNILFETEKTFPTCKRFGKLRFDIFIGTYNLLVEIHGAHHYKPTSYSSDKSQEAKDKHFADVQDRDEIKRQWAKENGYIMVELSYSDIEVLDVTLKPYLKHELTFDKISN